MGIHGVSALKVLANVQITKRHECSLTDILSD